MKYLGKNATYTVLTIGYIRISEKMELLNGFNRYRVQHCRGFNPSRKVLTIVIIFGIFLGHQISASTKFSDRLNKILRGPSQHGKKVPRWDPGSGAKLVVKRALSDPTPNSGYDDGGYDDGLLGSDYEGQECTEFLSYQFNDIIEESYNGPVCDIIDSRNSAEKMKDLENCTIVNGFVHLIFMHDLTEEDLKKYRFPKLRVITHYLLVFRMYNLRTLRYMFPNLAVIGGLELFKDYALIVYENPHLKEIGLGNLQFINNGGVRIQKNPMMCYASTINWERLGRYNSNSKLSDNRVTILDNREEDQCVNQCGDDANCDTLNGQKLCWGLDLCQKKLCPSECPHSCLNGRCVCDDQCLAGCTKPNDPKACIACRDKYSNGTCVKECPIGTYLIHGWLCIEKEECQKLDWRFYGNVCQLQCPAGYEVVIKDCMKVCTECTTYCGNVCDTDIVITDVHSLVEAEGCREIVGALIININGGSEVVERLDDAFKDLEVIGSLIVRRSFPLVTLAFLRNIKRITGQQLEQDMYSIYILGNQNLRELWNFTNHKVKIDLGKAFFHFNPQLCMSEVNKVRELTPGEEDDEDISDITNGDKATCDFTLIEVIDVRMFSDMRVLYVKICWKNFLVKDERTLIGYQVFYKESPEQNAKKNEGVDACRLNSWTIVDKPKSENQYDFGENGTIVSRYDHTKPGNTSKLLSNLKAYTQYAFYIQAYVTSTAKSGAASEIKYFTTKPARPTQPRNLHATGTTTSTIEITWDPPASPNGNITHYIVEWRRQTEEDLASVRSVDSCKHTYTKPVKRPTIQRPIKPATSKEDQTGQTDKECNCQCNKEQISEEDALEAQESTEFENYLQDQIFFPSPEGDIYAADEQHYIDYNNTERRFRRSLVRRSAGLFNISSTNSTAVPTLAANVTVTTPLNVNETTATTEDPKFARERVVVRGTKTILTGLHHYSEYSIQVYACNHASDPRSLTDPYFSVQEGSQDSSTSNYTTCSIEAMTMKRTASNKSADVIPRGSVQQLSKNQGTPEEVTRLYWKMPVDPNAYVRTFTIEVTSTDAGNANSPHPFCVHVNSSVTDGMSYDFSSTSGLAPGSYSARIRPISLAGEGNWTDPIAFEIVDTSKADTSVIIIVVAVFTFLVVAVGLALAVYFKTRKKPEDNSFIHADFNPEYARVYIPDEYEIDIEKVTVLEEIGHGNFGKVFSGLAKGIVKGQEETKVAIKKLHENAMPARRFEFLKEASMMKAFNAHHVVRLLGVISQSIDPMVIMEFMESGDLKSFLRSRRDSPEENSQHLPAPTLQEKLQMAAEIADGMAYLAAYKFVHRDLAARNCLVGEQGTVKIGDFGLTRDIYETDYYRKESRGFLPIRWMAPESLKDGIFDSRSDVWSYGVVLWELATLAEQPYQGQQHDEVTRFVIDGGYMERPRNCPKRLYDLMTVCWQYNPKMRPLFIEIVQELFIDVSEQFKEACFYGKHNQVGSGEEEEGQFLHEHSDGADFLYPDNDIGGGPSQARGFPENNVLQPNWNAGDNALKVVKNNSKLGRLSSTPPKPENEEKQGLLEPTMRNKDYPHSVDSRSPNTTSTTALTPPSSVESQNRRNRYSSESLYENDYEGDLRQPQTRDINSRDSGTFIPTSRTPNTSEKEPLVSYKHLNGGHKVKTDFDLESGVDEGMWGNSSTASASNPSTPTETHAMLPPSVQDDNALSSLLRQTASSNC